MKGLFLGLLILSLTACAVATPSARTVTPTATSAADLTRTDAQGAVTFTVTPLNLSATVTTPKFDVMMNTHSVDVNWDLAAQSVLKTDIGLEVTGSQWAAGSGHHYESTLVFPAQTPDGQTLLSTAKALTLSILNTDVPERTFVWAVTP